MSSVTSLKKKLIVIQLLTITADYNQGFVELNRHKFSINKDINVHISLSVNIPV